MINPSVISVVHSPISLRLCVSAREKGRGMGKLFWTSVIPSKKWQTTVRSNSFFRSLKLEITALRPTLTGSCIRLHLKENKLVKMTVLTLLTMLTLFNINFERSGKFYRQHGHHGQQRQKYPRRFAGNQILFLL